LFTFKIATNATKRLDSASEEKVISSNIEEEWKNIKSIIEKAGMESPEKVCSKIPGLSSS
jgi:hypothetical protein